MIVFDDLNFYISSIAAVNSALDPALVIRFEARRLSSPAAPPFFALPVVADCVDYEFEFGFSGAPYGY